LPEKASSLLAPKGCEWMTPEFYDRYLEWVQGEAKKGGRDILVWHPGMGWQPLCELFGKELPPEGTPLPCLNDSTTAKMDQRGFVRRGLLRYAIFAVLMGACWWLGPRLFKEAQPLSHHLMSRRAIT
jgi:Sulfotransferase domain